MVVCCIEKPRSVKSSSPLKGEAISQSSLEVRHPFVLFSHPSKIKELDVSFCFETVSNHINTEIGQRTLCPLHSVAQSKSDPLSQ